MPFNFQSRNYFVKGRECDLPDVWKLRHRGVNSFGLDAISAVKMNLYTSAALKLGVVKLVQRPGAG